MAKLPKLKVFHTRTGFYNALVAAPSQKAALKAWGATTDLFGAGRASIVEQAVKQREALGSPPRREVYRTLVRAGQNGMPVVPASLPPAARDQPVA